MNPLQATKLAVTLAPAAQLNGAGTFTAIDCLGYHYLMVVAYLGDISANAFTVMKLTGSNDDSTYGDITSGSTFSLTTATPAVGTSTTATTSFLTADSGQATTPNNNDNCFYVWYVDLKKATFTGATGASAGTGVRYIKPAITTGGASYICAFGLLSMADPGLITATDHGARAICIV